MVFDLFAASIVIRVTETVIIHAVKIFRRLAPEEKEEN